MARAKRSKQNPKDAPHQLKLGLDAAQLGAPTEISDEQRTEAVRGRSMIRISPGDVVAFRWDDQYHYAVVLTKIIMFGGNLVHAFYRTTDNLLAADELLRDFPDGFNAVVDFIFAKRQGRIFKVGAAHDYERFRTGKYFKSTHWHLPKARSWWIYDERGKQVRVTEQLTEAEKRLPNWYTMDDSMLSRLIKSRWAPDKEGLKTLATPDSSVT
jgi:hypothetical protein